MLEKYALVVVSALVPACLSNTVALEPEAKSVTLVRESDRPLRCKVLGKITGTSRSADEPAAKAGAENDFRNHAAELKANFAVAENERGGLVGTSSQRDFFIGGKALLCQTEAMEDADDKAAEKAKEQKEKEDADREQKAADEKQEASDKKKSVK
jgi:Domain of unknown function (DUF4156)